jgi:hypothetical protein
MSEVSKPSASKVPVKETRPRSIISCADEDEEIGDLKENRNPNQRLKLENENGRVLSVKSSSTSLNSSKQGSSNLITNSKMSNPNKRLKLENENGTVSSVKSSSTSLNPLKQGYSNLITNSKMSNPNKRPKLENENGTVSSVKSSSKSTSLNSSKHSKTRNTKSERKLELEREKLELEREKLKFVDLIHQFEKKNSKIVNGSSIQDKPKLEERWQELYEFCQKRVCNQSAI